LNNQAILIVGANGFIGNHLTNVLSHDNNVYRCDITEGFSQTNYFRVDALNPDYYKIFKDNTFDYCINCSGAANVSESLTDPEHDFDLNVRNVMRILTAINNCNKNCKLINISSAAVYGNPSVLPIKTSSPLLPISPYGYHKWMSEIMIEEFTKLLGGKACSLRIFSAYGDGQRKMLLWDLLQQIARSPQNIQLFGTGEESRDYIHIQDIIQQIRLVMQYGSFTGEVYNVANGKEVFIKDVATLYEQYMHLPEKIKFTSSRRQGDPLNWRADISQMLEWGYQQSIPIELGIKMYIAWAKENGWA
jgi:dTDP-glucose 4,6-dehydratase/UDP-glucose 4-epimerase